MKRGFEDPPIDGHVPVSRWKFVYRSGNIGVKANAVPLRDRSHVIVAEVFIPAGGAEGIILAQRGRFGGSSFFVKEDRLWYTGNGTETGCFGLQSDRALPIGACTLAFEFSRRPRFPLRDAVGPVAMGRLFINGRMVAKAALPAAPSTLRAIEGETVYCGQDGSGLPTPDYLPPFRFTGVIRKVIVDLSGDPYDPDEALEPAVEIVH
jgi:arylsulfatase